MVAPLIKSLKLRLIVYRVTGDAVRHEAFRLSWPIDLIVGGLTITWGRKSLFDDPRNRTMRVSLVVDAPTLKTLLDRALNQAITVDLPGMTDNDNLQTRMGGRASTTLFSGSVDSLKIVHLRKNGGAVVDLHATETWGASSPSIEIAQEPLIHVKRGMTSDQIHAALNRRVVVPPKAWPTGLTWTLKHEWGGPPLDVVKFLLTWSYIGRASFTPDHYTAWPTADAFRQFIVYIPPSNIVDRLDQLEQDSKDVPAKMGYNDGNKGFYTELLENGWPRNPGDFQQINREHQPDLPGELWGQTTDLALAQRHGLRRWITDYKALTTDPATRENTAFYHWATWENGQYVFHVDGDPIASLLGRKPRFIPIGGTLTITSQTIRHARTLVWSERY